MPGGGGGVDLDVITAAASDILDGKVIVDKEGNPLTGSMVDRGNWSSSELAAGAAVTVPGGKHDGSGKVTAKSLASQTPGTATAGHILSGQTAWVNGNEIPGAIPRQAGGTLTPSTSTVTASCANKYMTGNYTIPAFTLPAAGDIRKGVTVNIYGKTVTGTLQQWLSSPTDVTANETGVTKIGSSTGFFSFTTAKQINTFSGPSGGSTLGHLNTAVNVSSYKYLKLNVSRAYDKSSSAYYVKMGISLSPDGSGIQYGQEVYATSTDTNYAVIMDVTNYSGMYFIYISTRSASTAKENGIMAGTVVLSNS